MKRKLVFTLLLCLMVSIVSYAQISPVRINEILASNSSINTDRYGKYSDWIELVNRSNVSVSLEGYFITDDPSKPTKWTFPSVQIPANGYLLVWASKKDKYIDGELHTNFKLSSHGEFVGLYDSSGTAIDTVTFGEQKKDISFGRYPDGVGEFQFMNEPTPGNPNKMEESQLQPLVFQPGSVFFQNEISVSLTTNLEGGKIYFTTDGSHVNLNSNLYTGPIRLNKTTVIRARVFKNNKAVSSDVSQIYVANYDGTLPIISYATDSANLFGDRGILDHPEKTGRDWERPVSVNFLELNGDGFQINAGVRTHGGLSRRRAYPKQSTRLYFRSDYGASKLRYKLFPNKKLNEFDRIIVHSGGSSDQYYRSSGNHINSAWTLLRDPLNHHLLGEIGGIVSASRPVVLFINGKLWGVFHIRERIDDFYLESNLGIKEADLLKAYWGKGVDVKEGDLQNWNQLMDFFNHHHFNSAENYERAAKWINIKNMTDYFILNIFIGNWDMPHNNTYMFRERKEGAKWNYILWDTDVSFGTNGNPDINVLEWATRDHPITRYGWSRDDSEKNLWSTLILRKLLDNLDYRDYFIDRFCDLMNSTLSPSHIGSVVDSLAYILRPNIKFEHEKWPEARLETWEYGVNEIKEWAAKRPWHQREQLKDQFYLSGNMVVTLNVSVQGGGTIKINSIQPFEYPWTGQYFRGVPIRIEAIPAAGYEFQGWSNPDFPDTNVVKKAFQSDIAVTAEFVRNTPLHSVAINEIMASNDTTIADSDGDYPDWLELYNANSWDVNLEGYFLTDDKDRPNKWAFPDTIIKGHGYLLIWASKKNRRGNGELHTNFKISAKKEYIGFNTPTGTVMDSITVRAQETDISFARIPDGGDVFRKTIRPTPGKPNIYKKPCFLAEGTVQYFSNQKPISNISFTVIDKNGERTHFNANGTFQYHQLKAGENYCFVPNRPGLNTETHIVTMYDAALVARQSVGLEDFSTIQKKAGDVNIDGIPSMYDAGMIARFSLGLPVASNCVAGQWGFCPDTVCVQNIHSDIQGLNFEGFVFGDVSGDWDEGQMGKTLSSEIKKSEFLQFVHVKKDSLFISLKPKEQKSPVYSIEIDLSYDPGTMEYVGIKKTSGLQNVRDVSHYKNGRIRFGYFSLKDVSQKRGTVDLILRTINHDERNKTNIWVNSYYVNNQLYFRGSLELAKIEGEKKFEPSVLNYPNPFNSTTKIAFTLPQCQDIRFKIYNGMGAVIWESFIPDQSKGRHWISWSGQSTRGEKMPSGIYFLVIEGKNWKKVRKMILLR